MRLTKHGAKRTRERTGVVSERFLRVVLERGRRRADFSGGFRRYLDRIHFQKRWIEPVVYGHFIYLMGPAKEDGVQNVLITTIGVPQKFRGHLKGGRPGEPVDPCYNAEEEKTHGTDHQEPEGE